MTEHDYFEQLSQSPIKRSWSENALSVFGGESCIREFVELEDGTFWMREHYRRGRFHESSSAAWERYIPPSMTDEPVSIPPYIPPTE